MSIIPYQDLNKKDWDDFVAKSSSWFWSTSAFIDFIESAYPTSIKNLSFAVVDESKKIICVAPLIATKIEDDNLEFSMGSFPNPFPSISPESADTLKVAFTRIDELANEHGVSYSRFAFCPLDGGAAPTQALPTGFENTSITTNVIDLTQDAQSIFSKISKGHRYDIKKAQKTLLIQKYDSKSITQEIFDAYKAMYFEVAGRTVGTDARWQSLHDFIKKGFAELYIARETANPTAPMLSSAMTWTYKNKSYYALAATLASHRNSGIGALMQWHIIQDLKAKGVTCYELGWNEEAKILEDVPEKKNINISHFKSLFGGDIVPFVKGQKFYDQTYKKSRLERLSKKYQEIYGSESSEAQA